MFPHEEKPATLLAQGTTELLASFRNRPYIVLCGRNNCGKSYLLKKAIEVVGESSSYLGPQRYQNFNLLSPYAPSESQRSRKYQDWLRQFQLASQNLDNSPFNLQQAIAELSDEKRAHLIEIMASVLGAKMETLYTIPNNHMSQQYVAVNGFNLSFTSSGYRLVASLVTSLLSAEYDTYLIDEPELGISPEAQGAFSDFLFDATLRQKYFSHVKCIAFATHSTVFLDRKNISNNYFVSKNGNVIEIEQAKTAADINRIHFFLLGNRLESLYMPSAILIVEGKCDYEFIERVLTTRYPDTRFSIIQANSDSRIREVFNVTKNLFGDIQKSPYRDRIFAVIDSVHGTGLTQQLLEMGMSKENIVVWSKNGIEHYYPPALVEKIFGRKGNIAVNGDEVTLNGYTYKKGELLRQIVPAVVANTEHDAEFKRELLEKIEKVLC